MFAGLPLVAVLDAPEQVDDLSVDAAAVPLGSFRDPLPHRQRQTKAEGCRVLGHINLHFDYIM